MLHLPVHLIEQRSVRLVDRLDIALHDRLKQARRQLFLHLRDIIVSLDFLFQLNPIGLQVIDTDPPLLPILYAAQLVMKGFIVDIVEV